jgi:hypothetical protein
MEEGNNQQNTTTSCSSDNMDVGACDHYEVIMYTCVAIRQGTKS